MPKNKKKFIDKKNATTYNLIQRSLPPIGEDDPGYVPPAPLTREELLQRQEEQQQYGIFYADGYDYMKHLREVNHAGGVLEAQYDFRVGQTASDFLLETQSVISGASRQSRQVAGGGSRIPFSATTTATSSAALSAAAMLEAAFKDGADAELDPEIVEAMNEDFNFEDPSNVLDDNFIIQAKGILDDDIEEEYPGLEEDDELAPDYVDPTKSLHKGRMVEAWVEQQGPAEETQANAPPGDHKRTSTAAMIKQDCACWDDRFEKMMDQYDDEEIGGLDLDDHEQGDGGESVVLNSILAEKDNSQAVFEAMMLQTPDPDPVALKFQYEDDNREKRVKVILELDNDKYDCQSVADTRTSKAFQPKTLDPPQKPKRIILDPRTGIPREVLSSRRGRHSSESETDEDDDSSSGDAGSDILSLISSLSVARPKNESPEERKLRKQTLKGLRKERRIEKKSCRVAFREEKVRQEKEVANVQRRLKTIAMV
ncbi:hypothetical protein BV898_12268 [Hypsibius exemplaris]|uniref:Protein LTV1 homolog n=1 Tax=Hypsibius exemplaris TaxID=2072580 RepID=A0A1W0WEB8_HYPEX|nr:hypothetical protein BV898_12268 [Hypsibius exemplaris]